jgi:hypothetical protein
MMEHALRDADELVHDGDDGAHPTVSNTEARKRLRALCATMRARTAEAG